MKTFKLLALFATLALAVTNGSKASNDAIHHDVLVHMFVISNAKPNPILSKKDLCRASAVCRSWRRAASDDRVWRVIANRSFKFDLFPEQLFIEHSSMVRSSLASEIGRYKVLVSLKLNIRLEIGKTAYKMYSCPTKNQLMVAAELMGDPSTIRTYINLLVTPGEIDLENDGFQIKLNEHKSLVIIPTLKQLVQMGSIYGKHELDRLAPHRYQKNDEDPAEL